MGIRGLNNLLLKYNCIQNFKRIPNNINIIAIDANLYLCKYLYSQNVEVLYSILNQVLKFLSVNIRPIYIFDGKAPLEKKNTIKKRKIKKRNLLNKKNTFKQSLLINQNDISIINKIKHLEKLCKNISSNLINNVKQLLDILNIQYFNAIGEADYTCCILSKRNLVDACLTEDMDFLLFGSNVIINFKKRGIVNYLDKKYILKNIKLSENQFIELCIILGSDYHDFKIKIKPDEVYENLLKYNNISTWINNEDNQFIINYLNNCLNIKKFIKNTLNTTTIPNINKMKKNNKLIDLDILIHFFDDKINENCFPYHNTKSVKHMIQEINMKYI